MREDYSEVDALDREAFISSKNDVLSKSFVTDIYVRVIRRAIDDLIMYSIKRYKGEQLTLEETYYEEDAENFLFDPSYKIIIDDYKVDVLCSKCNHVWISMASEISSNITICPECGQKTSSKSTNYKFTENQKVQEYSLGELISYWGVTDIKGFREGIRRKIKETLLKKKYTLDKRIKMPKHIEDLPDDWEYEAKELLTTVDGNDKAPGNEDSHYKGKIQPIDFSEDQNLNLHQHNIVKYVCRYKDKGGVKDLFKAAWYLNRLIKLEKAK